MFAGQATDDLTRACQDMHRAINTGSYGVPRGLRVGCLMYITFTLFGAALFVALHLAVVALLIVGTIGIWALQLILFIIASPWAIAYAIQENRKKNNA
jgi:hypothetical protein